MKKLYQLYYVYVTEVLKRSHNVRTYCSNHLGTCFDAITQEREKE